MKKLTGPELLVRWREANGLTQRQAAEILSKNKRCSEQQVSHWECGMLRPNGDRRFDIAAITEGAVPADSWS